MEAVQARKQRMISGALTDQEVRSARIEELKMLFSQIFNSYKSFVLILGQVFNMTTDVKWVIREHIGRGS